MRDDSIFVLDSRAALVDTDALVERLKQGKTYAAIDVFDNEPLEADHPLRSLPNAYLTPHRAGGIMASVDRIITVLVDEVEAFAQGRPCRFPLTEAMIPTLDA
jgi:phosphoglycerate dehydrogenase-like enzyme